MPPRHHHGRFRGRRFGGPRTVVYETPVVYEESVILDRPEDLDTILVPPTDDPEAKIAQAGDLFPTFVTPEDAKRYLNEVDTGYQQLQVAIIASSAPLDFKTAWGLQYTSWTTFYTGATASVGWLNTKAVMDQTDRYQSQLGDWRKSFASVGGTPPGPPPNPPGQGIPGSGGATASDVQKIIAAVGVVAAIVVLGPTLMKAMSR